MHYCLTGSTTFCKTTKIHSIKSSVLTNTCEFLMYFAHFLSYIYVNGVHAVHIQKVLLSQFQMRYTY